MRSEKFFFLFLSFDIICGKELTLDILHINDIHSYFEETSHESTRCRDPSELCVGGIARVYAKAKEVRDRNPDTTIFLNSGDLYQGTVWYSVFKYAPVVEFGNLMNYTAMGLGNHDFDDHIAGITPFAEQVNFELLGSNLAVNTDTFNEGVHFNRSVVKVINGTKVGIIGYVTRITEYNFPDAQIVFTDEIESVRKEAEKLKSEGVEVIIGLGHSGYEIDKELARNIPLLDIVIGGHSHTFLYTPLGDDDIPEDEIEGPYPTYITSTNGKIIPVVQVKCFTKYLGHITVNFDSEGELLKPVEAAGVSYARPYLLDDNEAKSDPMIVDLLKKYQANLTEYKTVYGYTETALVTVRQFDSVETNIGNVLCESMADFYEDATISLINNGGVRTDIAAGDITGEDIFMVIPFENAVDLLRMKGSQVKKALEWAAKKLDPADPNKYPGFGLQVSGLRLIIRAEDDNIGDRVVSIKTINPVTGEYEDMDMEKVYNLAVGEFIAPKGKQHYDRGIFDDVIVEEHIHGTVSDYEIFKEWLMKNTPINHKVDGRIIFEYPD